MFYERFNWAIIGISLILLKWYTTNRTVCVAEVIFNVLYYIFSSKHLFETTFNDIIY